MAAPRQLSRDFHSSEFFGFDTLPEGDPRIARLEELVETVLQPTRDRWGPLAITSWIYWRDGEPRTGAHADGGTVDFVPKEAAVAPVAFWIATDRINEIGVVIDERDHVHVTRSGVQDRSGEYYVEPEEGEYVAGVRPGDRLPGPMINLRPPSIDSPGLTLVWDPRAPTDSPSWRLFYSLSSRKGGGADE